MRSHAARLLDHHCGLLEIAATDGRIIATATRYYASEGASFSGWVISAAGEFPHGENITRKSDAIRELWEAAREHERGQPT